MFTTGKTAMFDVGQPEAGRYLRRSSRFDGLVRWGLALATVLAFTAAAPTSRAADKVLFGLDWIPSGQHAPYYVAQAKGFFAANGLDVDMQRGYGSTDSVKRVAAGTTEIGFGDTAAVILSRGEGLKVKVFAMIYGNAPYSLLLRRDAGIKTPKDLVGKTLAAPTGGASRTMFPAFAKLAGIDANDVKWLTTDAANLLPVLLANRAAGTAGYYVSHFTDESKTAQNGVETFSMRYSDYGLKIYSNGLVARDETIRDRPDVLRRFVKAMSEAFAYTFANPKEAAELLVKQNPQLTAELVVGDIQSVKDLNETKAAAENGWGFIDKDTMLATRDVVSDVFNAPVAKAIPVEEFYVNQFIQK